MAPPNIKKNPSVSGASSSISTTVHNMKDQTQGENEDFGSEGSGTAPSKGFSSFAKLPNELQLGIWRYTLQHTQIIEVRRQDHPWKYKAKKEPTPLLSTCKDSLEVALALENANVRLGNLCERPVPFKPHRDILLLTTHEWRGVDFDENRELNNQRSQDNLFNIKEDNIQTLAIYFFR